MAGGHARTLYSTCTLAHVVRLGCCPDTVAHLTRPSLQYLPNQATQFGVLTDSLLPHIMARTAGFVPLVPE
jgi:hypothetical protein